MHETLEFQNRSFRVARESDVAALRRLVNSSYKELADMGLNYTATYQDEDVTRERIAQGTAFVLEENGEMIGTVLFKKENHFTGTHSAYVCQLAVAPGVQRRGIGNLLMDLTESLALRQGFKAIQLDTAKPAGHLVAWYQKRGYRIVGETHWEGKTYDSWIFEKTLR